MIDEISVIHIRRSSVIFKPMTFMFFYLYLNLEILKIMEVLEDNMEVRKEAVFHVMNLTMSMHAAQPNEHWAIK